jgi:aryl-alcohol dehydrogenase-like predicted oxidoreductase
MKRMERMERNNLINPLHPLTGSEMETSMEHRRFGRTGHMSTVAIFGAAAFWNVTQADADATMERVLAAGINHIDVAPSYGGAEERLGPWLARERARFFLGCKTTERTAEGALAELHRSLKLLRVESFDLYQIHAVTSMEELDAATRPGGAIEALARARDEGLTRYLGITGHGVDAPAIFLEALRRFDFDSVLFPLNFVQYANPAFRATAEELIRVCRQRDVGTMVIKSITRGPWANSPRHMPHGTNRSPRRMTFRPPSISRCRKTSPACARRATSVWCRRSCRLARISGLYLAPSKKRSSPARININPCSPSVASKFQAFSFQRMKRIEQKILSICSIR